MSEAKDNGLALDIAGTIVFARQNGQCFETRKEMRAFIAEEVKHRASASARMEVALLTEQFIQEAGEWEDLE